MNHDSTATIARLAALALAEYEQVRKQEAEHLNMRVRVLDQAVETARRGLLETKDRPSMWPDVVPWPEAVRVDELLDEMVATIRRFIVCEPETAIATALWCSFTWVIDHVQVAPLAVITAPEKRCGKSQLLTLIGKMSARPLVASNISPSATFRVIEAYRPTLLIDEADSFLKESEELRGIINSGHTRQSAYAVRNVGENYEPKQFSTWGAKAISGIGVLADTIMDRAIVLHLRRKLLGESVERLRHAPPELFETMAAKLARFAEDSGAAIAMARPLLPEALNDRAQDNWEPLLAIADYAGGDWPSMARETALKLSGHSQEPMSMSIELLADIQEVFEQRDMDRIASKDLLQDLCKDEEKSWATYNRGMPMKPRQLAKRLSEYGIRSHNIRFSSNDILKGYELKQFEDAFARYLTTAFPESATASQSRKMASYNTRVNPSSSATKRYTLHPNCSVVAGVAVAMMSIIPLKAAEFINGSGVADIFSLPHWSYLHRVTPTAFDLPECHA